MSPEPAEPPLHVALLGCGEAARAHADTLAGLEPVSRISCASRSVRRAEAFRREHDGYRSYGSYAGAMDDESVDAVLVLTPPAHHLELTLEAIRAGKHVIVEKPPFLRSVDVDRVERAAAEAGRQVLVAENYYYKPVRRRVAEVIRRGDIGEVLFVYVNALKRQEAGGWREDPELAGGGALFEGGIHWVDFVANLGLTLESASGRRPAPAPDRGGADRREPERSVLVDLDYAEGAAGSLYYSWEVPSPLGGARFSRIYGRKGSLAFESNGGFVALHGERTRFWPVPGGLADAAGYRPMFRDFLEALTAGRDPEYDLRLARRDLELVEQIYDSMETAHEARDTHGKSSTDTDTYDTRDTDSKDSGEGRHG